MFSKRLVGVFTLVNAMLPQLLFSQAAGFATIYSFSGSDGSYPNGTLVLAKAGVLYGATTGGSNASNPGTIYTLTPPGTVGDPWTLQTLFHTTGTTIQYPAGPVTLSANNPPIVYAAAADTAEGGSVFQLTPPKKGGSAYTFSTIHQFSSDAAGATNGGMLLIDSALLGTLKSGADSSGAFFGLTPPEVSGQSWSKHVLQFDIVTTGYGPNPGLSLGPDGGLYGVTQAGGAGAGEGTIFKSKDNTLSAIYTNDGTSCIGADSNAVFDTNGDIYFTCLQNLPTFEGAIYHLLKPAQSGGSWTLTVAWTFTGGSDGLFPQGFLTYSNRSLYGVTVGSPDYNPNQGPTVYQLTPPANTGGAYTLTTLYTWPAGDYVNPQGVIADGQGHLYGVAMNDGLGSVFELTLP